MFNVVLVLRVSQMICHGGNSGRTSMKALGLQHGHRNEEPRSDLKFGSMTYGLFALSYIIETINSFLGGARG